jgi:alpha-N-arabinofuranosidase
MMLEMVLSSVLLVLGSAVSIATDGIQNGSFEDSSPTQAWELNVFGAQPEVASDNAVRHEGAHALRITARELSDTALGQEITLKPDGWYRFSAWVKTSALDPHGAPTAGTIQVQQPRGAGVIAAAPNHTQDTDWTNAAVSFQAPSDGRVRLCLFFVGFGKGTGTVWFDDVKLDEIDVAGAPIRITAKPLVEAEISPLQYGQFVEYLCDLIPSMWSEKLYDGSFEGLSPYKFAFIAETDFKEKPWYPSGAVNRADYSLDRSTKVSGDVSKRFAVGAGPPCTVGISQDGVFVDQGAELIVKCWSRTEKLQGPVRVRLHHEGRVFAETEFKPGEEWKRYEARLIPNARDINATLTIEFRGPATLWIDNVSLMPTDTVGGWRKDVVEAVRALKPGVIRFGGSALDEPSLGDFSWKDTVGDVDRRKPFRAWGGLQPTGPGLEEIVQFCQAVDAQPLICLRFTKSTPRAAAGQVEYFNGPVTSPMGALRAKNGHPEPYAIKLWQIGNEVAGPEYEAQVSGFCAAIKAVDPSTRLLSSFPSAGTLRNAASSLDYVCPHHYLENLAGQEGEFASLRQLIADNAGGKNIKVAVTEWNTTAGDFGPKRAALMTLWNALACSRYHNLLHRHCDLVEITNRSNLINSFGSGILQTDNYRLYRTPTYYAQQLYATRAGTRPLQIDSPIPTNVGLDLSATLSAKDDEVVLFAINSSLTDITRPLDFSAFGSHGQKLDVWTLKDRDQTGEPDVANSFGDPERIAARESVFPAPGPQFAYRFPKLSLTVLKWRK